MNPDPDAHWAAFWIIMTVILIASVAGAVISLGQLFRWWEL